MLGIISKMFGGNKSEKDVKKIMPDVEKAKVFFTSYAALSNDELRAKTSEFKNRIKEFLAPSDAVIQEKKDNAETLPVTDIEGRDGIYKEIDALQKARNEKIEETDLIKKLIIK